MSPPINAPVYIIPHSIPHHGRRNPNTPSHISDSLLQPSRPFTLLPLQNQFTGAKYHPDASLAQAGPDSIVVNDYMNAQYYATAGVGTPTQVRFLDGAQGREACSSLMGACPGR